MSFFHRENLSVVLFTCAAIMLASPDKLCAQRISAPPAPQLQTEPRPLGTHIIFVGVNGEETVLPGLNDGFEYSDPVLSPDGKRLALTATAPGPTGRGFPNTPIASHIAIYTLPAGPVAHLEAPGQNFSASWVGTTGDVAYLRRMSRTDSTVSLLARNADGIGTEREVLSRENVTISGISWFADGKGFLLTHMGTRTKPRGAVLRFSLDRIAKPTSLEKGLLPSLPVISPDGSLIAYVESTPRTLAGGRVVPGTPRVYLRRLSGGNAVPVSAPNSDYPTWSTDGSILFYMSATSRIIYGVRVQTTDKLRVSVPVPITNYRVVMPPSRLVVLPGESLFVFRARPPIPETAAVPPELRGVRADSATQKLLELVAARALIPLAAERRIDLTKFALDSRSYISFADPVFAGAPQPLDSYLLPGRDAQHLSALATMLGVAGTVRDTLGCDPDATPPQCRRQPFGGIVDFSPAMVSADSARLYVHTWPTASAPNTVALMTRWAFTLARRGTEWVILRLE